MARKDKDKCESPAMAGMLSRAARALVRRAADGDEAALVALVESRAAVDAAIGDAARALNARGRSWEAIGRELGMTRQAAQQRFGGTKDAAAAARARGEHPDQLTLVDTARPELRCPSGHATMRPERCVHCAAEMRTA